MIKRYCDKCGEEITGDENFYNLKMILNKPEKDIEGSFIKLCEDYALCKSCKTLFALWLLQYPEPTEEEGVEP